ncbi:hypothetical protein UlMin_027923 [Ulmus minor]
MNRPPRGRGRRHVNRNVRGNASNLGNPAHSGPSQGGNAGNVGDNGDAIDRINQLAAAVTQMATMLTQINGMPIPPEVQQLGGEIPRLEASHHNENPSGDGRGRAPTVSHRAANTNRGPEGSRHENERSHNVADNSQNLSHHENRQRHDLRDDLNSRLHGQDMRNRINERRAGRAPHPEDEPLYLRQRFAEIQNNPVYQQIADLQEQIERLQRNNDPRNVAVRNLLEEAESPFSEDIRAAPMPPRLKLPDLKYDGTGDPSEHLETYKSWMELNSATNAFQCRAFVITLTGIARRWFRTLRPGSVFSFRQLSESFISQFAVNKVQRKPARHLYTVRQKENESTEAFLNQFVKEEMSVKDRNDSTACGALMAGLRSATVLKYMVSIKEDVSYPELISEIDSQAGSSKAKENGNSNGKKNNVGNRNPIENQIPRFCDYTPTTVPVATIYTENEHLGIFTIPPAIKTPVNRRDNTKYCRYHRDIGHITEECRVLKDEIERNGDQQPRQPAQENQQPEQEGEDIEVRVIIGGPATGDTNRARKNYARQARSEPFPHQINLAEHKNKAPRLSNEPIIFTEEEASGLWHPHKDAIVVALRIASRKVYKILIDNGSSADILFRSTLNRMDLVGAKFNPIKSALYGFTGDSIHSEGVLNLPVELGTHPCQHIQSVEFVVVDCPSSYNAIIGRPTLNAIQAVTSTYHLLVKFPTVGGIGILKGDQQASRDIYEAANRSSNAHRMNIIKTCKGPLEHPPPRTIAIDSGAGHPPPNKKSSSHEKFLQ